MNIIVYGKGVKSMLYIPNYFAIIISLAIVVFSLITSDWLWAVIFLIVAAINYLVTKYKVKIK